MSTHLRDACRKADRLPSDTLVTHCRDDSCLPKWVPIDRDVRETLRLQDDSRDELAKRNKRISSAYARLFLSQAPGGPSTKIHFIGAAAFGSKQVGCAMSMFRYSPTIEFARLASGNAAIYESFYPASRFYAENIEKYGKDWVFKCLEERYPPDQFTGKPAPVVEGLRLISEGSIKEGVLVIVRHEQSTVLGESMYQLKDEEIPYWSNMDFAFAMNAAIWFGQFEATYAASCSTSNKNHIVEYPGWTISYENRMRFFELSVDKFSGLWTNDKAYMTGELQKIQGLAPQ